MSKNNKGDGRNNHPPMATFLAPGFGRSNTNPAVSESVPQAMRRNLPSPRAHRVYYCITAKGPFVWINEPKTKGQVWSGTLFPVVESFSTFNLEFYLRLSSVKVAEGFDVNDVLATLPHVSEWTRRFLQLPKKATITIRVKTGDEDTDEQEVSNG